VRLTTCALNEKQFVRNAGTPKYEYKKRGGTEKLARKSSKRKNNKKKEIGCDKRTGENNLLSLLYIGSDIDQKGWRGKTGVEKPREYGGTNRVPSPIRTNEAVMKNKRSSGGNGQVEVNRKNTTN